MGRTLTIAEPGRAVETMGVLIPPGSVPRFVAGVHAPACVALGGLSLYLVAVQRQASALPTITWALYRRFGTSDHEAEIVTNNTLTTWTTEGDWSQRGSIVDVSGGLVTGYEWRACTSGTEALEVGLLWVVGHPTGLVRAVNNGGLV